MAQDDSTRDHADPLAEAMSPLALDRQRVIHSAAFRRLQNKTQVFASDGDDHFRTRMTHTLEVADVARSLAAALELDEDLAEVVALAHDLGHPPFGHAGEKALAVCMAAKGGFEHNVQSLHVVEFLEHPYPEFRGLNLTHVVRECLAKHATQYDKPGRHPLQDGRRAPLEGQVVDLADRIAYGLHDLQDGLYARMVDPAVLDELQLWANAREEQGGRSDWHAHLRPTIDRMQRMLLNEAADESRRRCAQFDVRTSGQARDAAEAMIALPARTDEMLRELETFLLDQLYRHQQVVRMDARGRRIVTELFDACAREPGLMPRRYAERVKEQGRHRVATDYIAGMTDRFCLQEHARLCG